MSDDCINPRVVYPSPKLIPKDEAEIEGYVAKIRENAKKERLTPRERFSLAARGIEPDRVPYVAGGSPNTGPKLPPPYDKCRIKEFLENPSLFLKAALALQSHFEIDIPKRWFFTYGQEEWAGKENVHYPDMGIPVWKNPVVHNSEDVDRLRMVDPRKDGKYPWNLWINKMQHRYLGDICVTRGTACSGPILAAWHLLGPIGFPLLWKKNPEVVHKFLNKHTKFDVELIKACYESGSDLVCLCEATRRHSLKMMTDLIKYETALSPASQFAPFGLKPSMGTTPMEHLKLWIEEAKPFAMGFSTQTEYYGDSKRAPPLKDLKAFVTENDIMGFHGISHFITREEPSVIESEIKRTVKTAAPGGRCAIIFGGLDWYAPYSTVQTCIRAVKRYGKYPIKI